MPQGSSSYLIMIVSIVLIGIMMWWQSRKAKQQQQKMKDFRSSLEPGTDVITIGGIIAKVVSVDEEYEEIVITNYDPRRHDSTRHWQLSIFNLSAADEDDGRYTLIHEPETKSHKTEERR